MSNATTALSPAAPDRITLVDRVIARSWASDIALVIAGTALVAVLAQVAVPLWPVPVTGQTLAVLLVGASLGAARGAASLALYAVLGLAGLPIFAPQDDGSHLTGLAALTAPSFGYIIGFIASAAIVGWAAERSWDRGWYKPIITFIGGSLVVFAFGLPWLAVALGQFGLPNDPQSVLISGFYPFIIGGIIKAAIAAALLPALWAAAERAPRHD
ncbi:biotin transporter BioY [Microcella frigidaquae]|uniref:Biotin transporter n=1 Tax=Microcella frigidaquae TaxID=424758 RepID=A0A840X6A0_9MICO|nr:biotin transport system substrate-specific component [Microcella frigidaquae]NHN43814.1 biotin transporter BioY [Microcella frigidaquae]